MQDPWARHRSLLQDGIREAAAGIEFSHAELVREQIAACAAADYEAPGLVCLRAAEAAGGSAGSALPAATALALLALMGKVFTGLESQRGTASLSTAWGMPRALNAGDAFFGAAQDAILTDEWSASQRLEALRVFDMAARDYVQALFAESNQDDTHAAGQRALLPAALELGALLGGASDAARARFRELGASWAELSREELAGSLTRDLAGLASGHAAATNRSVDSG